MAHHRISVAFIDLEPESVVLAKDLEHRRLGLLQTAEEHSSKHIPTTDPITCDGDGDLVMGSSSIQRAEENGLASDHRVPSVEETSPTMDTSAATELATQNQSDETADICPQGTGHGGITASTAAPSSIPVLMPPKDDDIAAEQNQLAVNNLENQSRPVGANTDDGKSVQSDITEPSGSTLQNPKDSSTNPRNSLRLPSTKRPRSKNTKSHPNTQVDWDEDLRPTDDEQRRPDNEDDGTSVSSPVLEDTSPFLQNPSKKRNRASKPRPTPAKRRKVAKAKSTVSRGTVQLPLTSEHGLSGKAMTRDSIAPQVVGAHQKCALTSGPLPTKPSDSGVKEKTDSSETPIKTLPHKTEKQSHIISKEDDKITISSCSPLSSAVSLSSWRDTEESHLPIAAITPDADTNGRKSKTEGALRQLHRKHHGRGETVGHKLTVALCEAGVLSQYMLVDEDRAAVSGISSGSDDEKHSHKSLGSRLDQSSMVPFSPTMPEKADSLAIQPKVPEPSHADSSCVTEIAPEVTVNDMALTESRQKTRPKSPDAAESKIGMNVMTSQQSLSNYDLDLTTLTDVAALHLDQKSDANLRASQPSADSLEKSTNVSSESTNAADIDLKTLLVNEREVEHTPESQRPLLAAQVSMDIDPSSSKRPKSVPRNSIVDQNGSPRLLSRRDAGLDGRMIAIGDTSPDQRSSDPETVEDSERAGDATSNASKVITAFQRDIFLEYHVLDCGKTTPGSKKAVGVPIWKSRLDFKKRSPSNPASASMSKTSAGLQHGKASELPPSSSQRAVDVTGKESEELTLERPESEQPAPAPSQPLLQPRGTTTQVECDYTQMEWFSSLQAAQKSAHEMLLETNQHLTRQLEAEQNTIDQVLEMYQQGFTRLLDELFQAQETRRELYRQQMVAVKEQHSQVCQNLIRRLQALDRQVQSSA